MPPAGNRGISKRSLLLCLAAILLAGCGVRSSATAVIQKTSEIPADQATEYQNLDLREANVLAVSFEALDEGEYRFDVTLIHDDSGEAPDFADWWQVEDAQGNLLGRRDLLHDHGTAAFTRSEVIAVPVGTDFVVVRAHDMRHGYGGQSMRVDMRSGATSPFDEGSDPAAQD